MVYTVTASTSVVLVNTLDSPNTVVLLSSIVNPGHIVGIRDITGSSLIKTQPIVVSTTNGIKFYDGSFSTLLNEPNASLIVSSRSPTVWQILNNQGFLTSLSTATLNTITTHFGSIDTLSSIYDTVSSFNISSINVSRNFLLLGDDYHFQNLTVVGSTFFNSSVTIQGTAFLSTGLTVTGDVKSFCSIRLKGSLTGQANLNVLSDINIGENLYVSSLLSLQEGTLLPKNLSIQTLLVSNLHVAGFMRVAGTLSTMSSFAIGESLVTTSSITLLSTLSSGQSIVSSNINILGPVQASTLSVSNNASIQQDVSIQDHSYFYNTLSSLGTLQTTSSIRSEMSTILKKGFYGLSTVSLSTLTVQGSAFFSSLVVQSSLGVGGNLTVTTDTLFQTLAIQGKAAVGTNLTVSYLTSIGDSLSTQSNVYIGENLFIQGMFSTLSSVTIGGQISGVSTLTVFGTVSTAALHVKSTLSVQGSMSIIGNLVALGLSSSYAVRSVSTLQVSTQITTQNAYISYLNTQALTSPSSFYVNTTPGLLATGLSSFNVVVGGNSYVPSIKTSSFQGTRIQTSSLQYSLTISSINVLTNRVVFQYTGTLQTYTVPAGIYSLNVSMWGAGGASISLGGGFGGTGGAGAYISGTLDVIPGQVLSILVGQGGRTTTQSYGGGGKGGTYSSGTWGTGGGGRSAILLGGSELVTVGGGGGAGAATSASGGYGGYTVGSPGLVSAVGGGGGTLTSGGVAVTTNVYLATNGSLHQGGDSISFGGGGGGGYYGGAGGAAYAQSGVSGDRTSGGGGGGGSSTPSSGSWTLVVGSNSPNGQGTAPATTVSGYVSGVASGSGTTGGNGLVILSYVYTQDRLLSSFVLGSTSQTTATFPMIDTGYPVVNVASRFQSTLYSDRIIGTTIYSSTVTGSLFTGDGANLSNVIQFTQNPIVSLLSLSTLTTLTVQETGTGSALTNTATIGNSLTINNVATTSTTSLLLLGGSDFSNADIKTSYQNGPWIPSASALFDGVTTALTTNRSSNSPLYVATGQSSNPLKTIQWSTDGSNWNYSLSGGFTGGGGNDVTYFVPQGLFIAVGSGPYNIQYSGDGKNWSNQANNFTDYGYQGIEPNNKIKFGANTCMAIRTSPTWGSNSVIPEIKMTLDGITWSNAPIYSGMNLISYGFDFGYFSGGYYWFLFDYLNIMYSISYGYGWNAYGNSGLSFIPTSMFYNSVNSNWLIGGSNSIQLRTSILTATTTRTINATAVAITYDTINGRYLVGATSTNPLNTLYQSIDGITWSPLTTGGYYSGTLGVGAGYGILNAPNFKGINQSTTSFFFGSGSIDGVNALQPMLIANNNVSSFSTVYTFIGGFSNGIRGMGYSSNATTYKVIAVGDGPIPTKTIGAYTDTYSIGSNYSTLSIQFIPAITGGFSTVGYGVTYYTPSSLWLATGQHNLSANTIQYSMDGLNWRPTNINTAGVRLGGRAITWGEFKGLTKILVAGSDPASNRCIVVGDASYTTWRGSLENVGFSGYQANGVAISPDKAFVVGTRNSNGTTSIQETIKYTTDMSNWASPITGGFSNAGYGVAVKYPVYPYVIAGLSPYGVSSNDTIKYSSDGINWFSALAGIQGQTQVLTYANGLYVAGGTNAIIYSSDGKNWSYGKNALTGFNLSITYFANPWNGSNIFYQSGFESQEPSAYSRFSYDGINWSTIKNPLWDGGTSPLSSGYLLGVVQFSDKYISFGIQGYDNSRSNMMYSTDLLTWTNATGTFTGGSTAFAGATQQYPRGFATGLSDTGTPLLVASASVAQYYPTNNSKLKYTTDGITWNNVAVPDTIGTTTTVYNVLSVAYGGGKWLWLGNVATGTTGGGFNTITPNKSIWYSTQGSNNYTVATNCFNQTGYSASYNSNTGLWIATGLDTNGYTTKYSGDGITWSNASGDIITAATGSVSATTGLSMPALSSIIVAVGDSGSSNSQNSIQYSYNGGIHFYPASTNYAYIRGIGYGVTYNPYVSTFYAVGQDSLGTASTTILRSVDGKVWSTNKLAVNGPNDYQKGFASQILVGTTRRVGYNQFNTNEENTLFSLNNLAIYQRSLAVDGFSTINTIRYISSLMTLNETLSFNLSSQMMINSNTAYPGAVLTVNGSVYASSIFITGTQSQVGPIFNTTTFTASTLILQSSLITYGSLSTPTLGIYQTSNITRLPFQNNIVSYLGSGVQLNSLFVSPSTIGINISSPQASLHIGGTTGTTSTTVGTYFISLSTSIVNTSNLNTLMTFNNSLCIQSQTRATTSTSIVATNTSLAFNNLVFFNLSSQQIGIGTSNPTYNLDVRYPVQTYSILSSPKIHIQVLRPSVVYL